MSDEYITSEELHNLNAALAQPIPEGWVRLEKGKTPPPALVPPQLARPGNNSLPQASQTTTGAQKSTKADGQGKSNK